MAVIFKRPTGIIERQSKFSDREVGLNHPDVKSFIKIADNGDIQIMVDEATGIIISPATGTITLVANTLKLLTNADEGFKWNEKAFNYDATTFNQPTLRPLRKFVGSGIYDNITHYLD